MEGDAPSSTSRAEILAAGIATPIAQLSPELSDQQSRVVRGEITIVWPYSTFRKSFAFVIAEPDVRLRNSSGQIRLQIDGAIAKLVAESGVESGDEILLSLAGAGWAANTYEARISGSCSSWQLEYKEKITLQIKPAFSEDTKTLDVTNSTSTEPDATPELSIVEAPVEDSYIAEEPLVTGLVQKSSHAEFNSPAFIKRARLSYGSLFEPDHDPFAEDDGGVKGKGRKRARFGRYSASWRYASHTPSPEPSDAGMNEESGSDTAATGINGSPIAAASAPKSSKPEMGPAGHQVAQPDSSAPDQGGIDLQVELPAEKTCTIACVPDQDPPLPCAPPIPAKENAQVPAQPVDTTHSSTFGGPSTLFGRFESSNGDYSVPRFQTDISGIQGGPSIEDQVRFGFHHSPTIPLASQEIEMEHSQPFPQTHDAAHVTSSLLDTAGAEVSGTARDLPSVTMPTSPGQEAVLSQTIPLWNLSNEQILDPEHADAELPIDPILTAALDADGKDTELVTSGRTALPSEANLYGSYSQHRYHNEVGDDMVEGKANGAPESSEESMNPDEAEYERELANESYDDYDMRNYADVDDDVDGPYNIGLPGEEDEEGNYYYTGESEGQGEEDEEEFSEEDESDGDSQDVAATGFGRITQETGPVVIDLLSDSSDDESEASATSPSAYPAETERNLSSHDVGQESHLVVQTSHPQPCPSQPSPFYQVYSDPSHVDSDSEPSEEDAEGEDDDIVGFDSPVRSVVQTEPESDVSQMPTIQPESKAAISSSQYESPKRSNHEPLRDAENQTSAAKPNDDDDDDDDAAAATATAAATAEMTVPMMSGALFPTAADEMQESIETVEEINNEERAEIFDGIEHAQQSPATGGSGPGQEIAQDPTTPESLMQEHLVSEQAETELQSDRLPTPTQRQISRHENTTSQPEEYGSRQDAQATITEQVPGQEEQDDAAMKEFPLPESEIPVQTILTNATVLEEKIVVETRSELSEGEPGGAKPANQDESTDLVVQAVVSIDVEQVTSSRSESEEEATNMAKDSAEPEQTVTNTVKDVEITAQEIEIIGEGEEVTSTSPGLDQMSTASPDIERPGEQSLSSLRSVPGHSFLTQIHPSEPGYVDDDLLLMDTQRSSVAAKPDDHQAGGIDMGGSDAVQPEPSAAVSSQEGADSHNRFASQEPMADDVDMVDAGSLSENADTAKDDGARDDSGDGDESVEAPESINNAVGATEVDDPESLSQGNRTVEDKDSHASPVLGLTDDSGNEASAKDGLFTNDNEEESLATNKANSGSDEVVAESLPKEEIRLAIHDDFRNTENENASVSDISPVKGPDEDDNKSDMNEEASLATESSASDDSTNASEAEDADNLEDEDSSLDPKPRTRATRSARKSNETKTASAAYKLSKTPEADLEDSSSDEEPEQASIRVTRGARKRDAEQTPSAQSQNTPQPDDASEVAADGDPEPDVPSTRTTRASRKTEASDAPVASRPVTRATKPKQGPAKADSKAGKVKPPAHDSDPSVRLARGALNKKGNHVELPQEQAEGSDGDPSIRLARAAVRSKRKQLAEPTIPAPVATDGDPNIRLARAAAGNKRKQPPFEPAELTGSMPDGDPSVSLARAAVNKRKRVSDQFDVSAPAVKNRMTTRSASSSFRRSASPAITDDPNVRLAKGPLHSPSRRQKPAGSTDSHSKVEAAPSSNSSNQIKIEVTRRLREDLPDYQTLLRVPKLVGKTIDVLTLATTPGTEPKRTRTRQYCMSFNITDASISSRVYEVQLYRLHKESLPIVKPGDRVLLRDFIVAALTDRGWGLCSVEKSSYAVFDDADEIRDGGEAGDKDGGGSIAQIRGPPLELTAGDHEVSKLLKQWWESLDDDSRDRLDKQNRKLAAGALS